MKYSAKFFKNTMPEWKRKKDPLIARVFHRPISFVFSSVFCEIGLTPNQVSFISFIIAIITCICFLSDNTNVLLTAAVLMNIWSITDSADGNMARSLGGKPYGDFIDATSSYFMVGFMYSAMGFSIYKTGGYFFHQSDPLIIYLGALASSFDTMTRLFFQKMKNNYYEIILKKAEEGSEIEKGFDNDRTKSWLGRIQIRIDSEIGLGGWGLVAVFLCIFTHSLDLYVLFYFIYYAGVFCLSMVWLIKKTKCLQK